MTEVGKETENEELFPEAVFGEKDYLSEVFGLEQHDIRMYSPLTLAYIGDAAYEIVIRTILVRKANMQVNKLHRHAAGLVKAEKQSAMIEILEPLFTEEEKQIYKRGRNAKSYTKAKNASTIDYRRATGFEVSVPERGLQADDRPDPGRTWRSVRADKIQKIKKKRQGSGAFEKAKVPTAFGTAEQE